MTAAVADDYSKDRMPKQKPSPGKVVIPVCSCGSQVYGCIPLVTVSGVIVPDWFLFMCQQCGYKFKDKAELTFKNGGRVSDV